MMLNQIIGFLLVAITAVAMGSTPDEDQIEFIEDLNEIRRVAANVYEIRNMHELTYSEGLANVTEILVNRDHKTWEEVKGFQKTWRLFYLKDYENWQKDVRHFFNNTLNSKADLELKDNTLELLVPRQKEVSCSKMPDGQRRNIIFSEYQIICVIGNEGSKKSWEESKYNISKKCSNGYNNHDGLCIPTEDASQLEFISRLNKIRRAFAKKHNYPNMHKLVFSRKLARMAQYHTFDETTYCLHTSCRYTEFDNYKDGHKELNDRFEEYNSLSEEMKRKELKDGAARGYTRALEHLVPLQTEIGCFAMIIKDSKKHVITCFLGPQGSLDSLDSRKSAGTTCLENYKIDDGLCVQEYEIGMKNDEETTEQPEIFIDKNKSEEASTVPTQDSVTTETSNPENPTSKTAPPDGNSNGIPTIKSTKVTSAPSVYVPETTVESELDRLIAKYKREEQDGDVPSDEDEEEYEYSNSGRISVMISVILMMTWTLF